jgi:hypothetical protein
LKRCLAPGVLAAVQRLKRERVEVEEILAGGSGDAQKLAAATTPAGALSLASLSKHKANRYFGPHQCKEKSVKIWTLCLKAGVFTSARQPISDIGAYALFRYS